MKDEIWWTERSGQRQDLPRIDHRATFMEVRGIARDVLAGQQSGKLLYLARDTLALPGLKAPS